MIGEILLKYYQACWRAYCPAKWKTHLWILCLYMFSMDKKKPNKKRTKEDIHIVITIMTFSSILGFLPYCRSHRHTGMSSALDHPSDTLSLENCPWLERPHKAYIH